MFKSFCIGLVALMMLTVSVKEANGIPAPAILYSVNVENTLHHTITVEVAYDRFVGEGMVVTQEIKPGQSHLFETHSFTQEITQYYYYIKSVKVACPEINEEIVANAPFAGITSPTKDHKVLVTMDSNKLSVNLWRIGIENIKMLK